MAARLRWVAGLALAASSASSHGPPRAAPVYTPQSIVNAAAHDAPCCAPYSLITIYGQDLAFTTQAVSLAPESRSLPNILDGVRVHLGAQFAHLLYVSPTQINALVPGELVAGGVELRVSRNGLAGPGARVNLLNAAPAFFPLDDKFAIAIRPDGSLITPQSPVRPGERIILFGTGWGPTQPRLMGGAIPSAAMRVTGVPVEVLLDEQRVEAERVEYLGVTPGFAGLYQLNLLLPDGAGENPEIRLRIDRQDSPPRRHIPVRRENPATSSFWDAFNRIGW